MSDAPPTDQPTHDDELPSVDDMPYPTSINPPKEEVTTEQEEQAISDAIDEAVAAAIPSSDGVDVEEVIAASLAATVTVPVNEATSPIRTVGRVCPVGEENTGRWLREEQERFIEGLEKYGKEWKKVAAVVETRTIVQVRTHAQKFQKKLAKLFNKKGGEVNLADFNGVSESVGGRLRLRVGESELKRFEKLHELFSTTHGGYGKS